MMMLIIIIITALASIALCSKISSFLLSYSTILPSNWGDGEGGHWLVRLEWDPAGFVCVSHPVNLPLHHKVQKFSSGTGSPGWSQKKGHKTVVVWFYWVTQIITVQFSEPQCICMLKPGTKMVRCQNVQGMSPRRPIHVIQTSVAQTFCCQMPGEQTQH